MAYVRCGFISILFAGLLLAGCGLTAEQQKRIDDLSAQNEALVNKQRGLLEKVKLGTATPVEVAEAFKDIAEQMKKNAEEIKEIKDSSSTGTWLAVAGGLFGRTLLHAAGAAIPGAGPVAMALQGLLTLLLGGSTTVKPKPPGAPTV
jgi:outer membrane murein-binding lipoprotein Lpp